MKKTTFNPIPKNLSYDKKNDDEDVLAQHTVEILGDHIWFYGPIDERSAMKFLRYSSVNAKTFGDTCFPLRALLMYS